MYKRQLLEASLGEEVEDEILEIIRGVPGVKNPHNLRTRKIGNYVAIDIHIEVDGDMSVVEAHSIADAVEHRLKEVFGGATHVSVHVEPH